MKRIKTFESFNPNIETVNEEFTNNVAKRITEFLKDPTDESIADKLLKRSFVVQFNAKSTKSYQGIVLALSLEEKIRILQDVSKRLEYSSPDSLRIIKSNTSDKMKVGSIERRSKIPTEKLSEV